jgi:hypothetical protein
MVRVTAYRVMARALVDNGCKPKRGKDDHVKWYCPCGEHMAVVPEVRDVSPGVVRDVIAKLACLAKGRLQ